MDDLRASSATAMVAVGYASHVTQGRRFWEAVYASFNPEEAIRDVELLAHRELDPLPRIARRLGISRAPHRSIISGISGAGKSSSLFQLGAEMASDRLVVFVDLHEHVSNQLHDPTVLDRVEAWELLGLLGLAIVNTGESFLGHRWSDAAKALVRLLSEAEPRTKAGLFDVDVPVLSNASLAGALSTALVGVTPVAGALWSRLSEGIIIRTKVRASGHFGEVVDAINPLLDELEQHYGRQVLLLIDGLDRVSAPEQVLALFGRASWMRELKCGVVATAPDLLTQPALRAGFEIVELPNLPVLDHSDPRRYGPGIGFFVDLVDKRLTSVRAHVGHEEGQPIDDPFPPAIVDRLAYSSGGIVSDFVRLIRLAAERAWDEGTLALDESLTDAVVFDRRRELVVGLTRDERAILSSVAQDVGHGLPDDPHVASLMRRHRLIAYPNETVWYYPHPLLSSLLSTSQLAFSETLGDGSRPAHEPWIEEEWTLGLRNWRRFEEVSFGTEGVSLLAGANGAGKTSILGAFGFLCDVASRGVTEACRLAGGGHLVRRLDAKPDELVTLTFELGPFRWQLELVIEGLGVQPNHGESLHYNGDLVFERQLLASEWNLGIRRWSAAHPRSGLRVAVDSGDFDFLAPLDAFLMALRVYPSFVLRDVYSSDLRAARTSALERDGGNLIPVLNNWKTAARRHEERFEWVLTKMREAFPDQVGDIDFVVDGQTIQAYIYGPGSSKSIPLHLAADGVITGLLQLTAVAGAERGSLIAIDELENHLHPHAIRSLLQSMRELAEDRNLTVLLTTHSPVLMNEFKGHEDQFFVLEPGFSPTPKPLDEVKDPQWLAHFSLGDLYSRLRFGGPSTSGD